MAQVFAGFVCGFGLSLIYAPLLAVTLLRLRATSVLVARMLPAGVNPVALTLILQGGLVLFWTGLGIILGLLLLLMEGAPEALGSMNGPFTLFVFAVVFVFTAPFAVLVDAWRYHIIASGLAALLVFGWFMPYLATWTKFD